jgi:hypothetical protein
MPDTTISGNGFLLLWADEDKSQGPLHMSFKLSSAFGENIYLSYFNGDSYRILDSIDFGSMGADQSQGCLPDGIRPLVAQNPSSPGYSNVTVGIATSGSNFGPLLYPNPAADLVWLNSSNTISEIEIIDVAGKIVLQRSSVTGLNNIAVRALSPGIYTVFLYGKSNDSIRHRLIISR